MKIRTKLAVLGCTVSALAISGCGSQAPSPGTSNSNPVSTASSSGNATSPAPGQATASSNPDGSLTVTISPQTYDSASPCASVKSEALVSDVPAACQQLAQAANLSVVPGQDLMVSVPRLPRTFVVDSGIAQQDAENLAMSWFRTEAFHWFEYQTGQPNVGAALDVTGAVGRNPLESAFLKHGSVGPNSIPNCVLPTQARVVKMSTASVEYLHTTDGYPNPSSLGLLFVFPDTCRDVSVSFPDGHTEQVIARFGGSTGLLHGLESGKVETVGIYGAIFSEDGSSSCKSAVFQDICTRDVTQSK